MSAHPARGLGRRERATLAAAAETIFPRGGEPEVSGADAGVPDYVDRLVAAWPARQLRLVRLLLFAVEHGTLLFPGPDGALRGRRRFSRQPQAAREALLEGWRTSPLFARRLAFTTLRALVTLGYLGDPAVQRALGIAPRAIEPHACEADALYPRIGAARTTTGPR